eukprot:scaffold5523_cov58-Phaeocystis_antarctica.AAC.2
MRPCAVLEWSAPCPSHWTPPPATRLAPRCEYTEAVAGSARARQTGLGHPARTPCGLEKKGLAGLALLFLGLAGGADYPYRRVCLQALLLHVLREVVSAEDETHVPELLKLLLDIGRVGLIFVRGSKDAFEQEAVLRQAVDVGGSGGGLRLEQHQQLAVEAEPVRLEQDGARFALLEKDD